MNTKIILNKIKFTQNFRSTDPTKSAKINLGQDRPSTNRTGHFQQAYKFSKRNSQKRQSEASRFALCLNFSLFSLIRLRFFDKANLKSERFSLSFALLQSEFKATKRN